MRIVQALPLLTLASAFVITDNEVFERIENSGRHFLKDTQKSGQQFLDNTENFLDNAFEKAVETVKDVGNKAYHKVHEAGCDVESWLEGSPLADEEIDVWDEGHPPHHGPPHHGPPHHGKPKHPHHGHKSNLTVYELISKSNFTTKLAKLIDEYDDLVEALNSTKANYTIFAPIDSAFDKIPEHGKKPSKDFLKKLLLYHVTDDFYPAGRVIHSYTIPTLYKPDHSLGHNQRLIVRGSFRGLTINYFSKIIAVNVVATNGVIHGLDSILIPPPPVATILSLLPSDFSTLELAFRKTGLYEKLNSTEYPHEGGTLFAPTNFAFSKLGLKVNAFLFSEYGLKYLKALLKYHIVVNQTLYSDAFFDATDKDSATTHPAPRHYDLPTALENRFLAIDVIPWGPFIYIKINGHSRVTVQDGVAADGVIQVVSDVLIPPRKRGGETVFWKGEPMSVEEFKERVEPYIEEDEVMEL